jgi:hypothetical protein
MSAVCYNYCDLQVHYDFYLSTIIEELGEEECKGLFVHSVSAGIESFIHSYCNAYAHNRDRPRPHSEGECKDELTHAFPTRQCPS